MTETFETPDLGLIAALHSLHIPIVDKYAQGPQMFYIFEQTDELTEIVDSYHNNTLSLPALSYFFSIKEIKRQVKNFLFPRQSGQDTRKV